jgi:hypothetical protein
MLYRRNEPFRAAIKQTAAPVGKKKQKKKEKKTGIYFISI